LLDLYNREIAGRPGPEEVKLRIILTDTEKEATDLIADIRGGADFATLARRHSKDSTASVGGDIGFQTREQLNPQIGAVAFSLPPGEVMPYPLHGSSGWFVVRLEERRRQPTPSFASVREKLSDRLLQQGVIQATDSALAGLTVRKYNLLGQEIDNPTPETR